MAEAAHHANDPKPFLLESPPGPRPEKSGETRYEFGPFQLDPSERTLTCRGARVALTPKAFDTLFFLVSYPGHALKKEELLERVWPDTFVDENNLTQNISALRKALGEFDTQVFIETVPRLGYRFVVPVREVSLEPLALEGSNGQAREIADAKQILDEARVGSIRERSGHRSLWALALLLLAAMGLAVSLWDRNSRDFAPTLRRLTSDTGLTTTPTLSPDGKLIAYASDRSGEGNLNLWVQPVNGGEPQRLTAGAADDYSPSFSPDGRIIAFRSEREGGGVYAVPAQGGEARLIAPHGRNPKFSLDGKWITYWTGAEGGDAASDSASHFMPPGMAHIYIVPSAGGSPRELCSDFPAAGYPIWTPDGHHLLFLGNSAPQGMSEDGTDWFVAPIEGGPAMPTGAAAAFRKAHFDSVSQAPEVWATDGKSVLISANLAGTRSIWRVPISSTDWKVYGALRRLTTGTTFEAQPTTAGSQFAYASLDASLQVWALPLDSRRPASGGQIERLTQDSFSHAYPVVSSDGNKLAFASRRSGNLDIWVRDLRTGSENEVSLPPGPSLYPAFSPDGLTLLYKQLDHNKWSLYAVSLAGGRTERILEDSDDYGWSSDGRRLVVAGPPPPGIDLLDLTSKRSTPLLRHARWSLWNPRFSPDDRWVAFNATEPGFSRIFVAPLRGGGLIPEAEWIAITPEKWADKPRWSPDGEILYFISERDGFRCIWAQPLDSRKHPTGRAIPVFHAHEARRSLANVGIGDLELSVARDKLVFNMSERTGNLWMMNLR